MWLKNNCLQNIFNQFKLKNFKFNCAHPHYFYQSQWQQRDRSVLYLLYRWAIAAFFLVLYVTCASLQFNDGKFFIFLTNWGILLCMITNVIAAVLVTRWFFNIDDTRTAITAQTGHLYSFQEKRTTDQLTPILKVYWLFHTVTLLLALIITTVYWAFLHGHMNKPQRFPGISFTTHCLNSVFMLIDFIVIGFPMRLMHIAYAMLLPIIYCVFTVIYFFCGGTDEFGNGYVYPILNWKNPGKGMITFAGVFCLYLIYGIILYFIYKFKRWIHRVLKFWKPHAVGFI